MVHSTHMCPTTSQVYKYERIDSKLPNGGWRNHYSSPGGSIHPCLVAKDADLLAK